MMIDFHAHAFPDALAERAMPMLEQEGNVKAVLDGKVSSLLRSMDEAGVHASVVASIATRPHQFDSILKWSAEIVSDRIIPFPSVHPGDPEAVAHLRLIHEQGFKGVKLHPYYQEFDLDEERLRPLYAALQECGLVLLCHTGFDLAFPRIRKCDPVRIGRVREAFPGLKFVAAHLGAWEDWDEVERHLIGRPIFMDVSYAIDWIGPGRAREFILRHPRITCCSGPIRRGRARRKRSSKCANCNSAPSANDSSSAKTRPGCWGWTRGAQNGQTDPTLRRDELRESPSNSWGSCSSHIRGIAGRARRAPLRSNALSGRASKPR